MAEATFTPAAPPGFAASSFVNGLGQGQSLMLRAQQARLQQEDAQRQQELHQAMMPSLLAKAQADTMNAQATIQNFNQVQGLRQRFASEAPIAQKEFQDAMQLADYGAQSDELGKLQQKYSWMQLLPEGKPFAEGLANMRLQAHQSWQLNKQIEAQKDVAQIRGDNLLNGIVARGDQARQTNDASGKGLTPEQRWYKSMQEFEDNGDDEGASFMRQRLIKAISTNTQLDQAERVRRLQLAVDDATARGNPKAASQFQAELDKFIAPTHSNAHDDFLASLGLAPKGEAGAVGGSTPPTAPTPTPTPVPKVPVAGPPRAYVIDPQTKTVSLAPSVKQPKDVLAAVQQMVDDGIIDEATARAKLDQLGFKKKGK